MVMLTALFAVGPVLAGVVRSQPNAVGNGVLALLVCNAETFAVSKHVIHFFQCESLGLGYEEHDEKGTDKGEGLCQI